MIRRRINQRIGFPSMPITQTTFGSWLQRRVPTCLSDSSVALQARCCLTSKKGKTYELTQSDFFFSDGGVNLGDGDM
jgi:hypothetical protein